MSAHSKQALVLDFGGVVSKTMFETHDLTEQSLGLPKGSLTWMGPFDTETDPLWRSMQQDEISERDYWHTRTREVGELVGEKWDNMQAFVQRARGADPEAVIRPEALAAIKMAHENGIVLAVLSNELDLFYGKEFRTKLPFLKLFETIVDATYTGILKPDPRAYHFISDALDLPLSACVFVDDQARNIEGAKAVGMRTVHFDVTDPKSSYHEALALLGLATAAR